jgi:transcriptional regulator with XRE-family HTH domain
MEHNSRHGDFGRHVRSLRKARSLTQEALAERSGLSTDAIRRLERCAFSPGLDTLRKIGGGLDLQLSTLFDSYELNGRDVDRELAELLAGRSPEERDLVFRLARTALAGIDELREAGSSDPDSQE